MRTKALLAGLVVGLLVVGCADGLTGASPAPVLAAAPQVATEAPKAPASPSAYVANAALDPECPVDHVRVRQVDADGTVDRTRWSPLVHAHANLARGGVRTARGLRHRVQDEG